jgi:hypothetical protein
MTAIISYFSNLQPHGRAWRILDRERLVRDVIPKYFSSSKYHSFCRQLNWWGFKRLCGPGPGKSSPNPISFSFLSEISGIHIAHNFFFSIWMQTWDVIIINAFYVISPN